MIFGRQLREDSKNRNQSIHLQEMRMKSYGDIEKLYEQRDIQFY